MFVVVTAMPFYRRQRIAKSVAWVTFFFLLTDCYVFYTGIKKEGENEEHICALYLTISRNRTRIFFSSFKKNNNNHET